MLPSLVAVIVFNNSSSGVTAYICPGLYACYASVGRPMGPAGHDAGQRRWSALVPAMY